MTNVTCNLDFFGAAGSPLIQALLDQSSNNRARKVAFNNLVRMAKAAKLVVKDAEISHISFVVDAVGIQKLEYTDATPRKKEEIPA